MSSTRSCNGQILYSASKTKRYSLNEGNLRASQHVPSVRCHEEKMSKMTANCYDACKCHGDDYALRYQDCNKVPDKDRKKKNKNHKADDFDVQSLVYGQDNPKKKSKSLSHLQKPNLEDSMDYVPVKLSSENCLAKQQREEKLNQDKRVTSGSRKLTWDQILRGEGEVKSRTRSNKYTNDVVTTSKRNNESHPNSDECLSNKLSKKNIPKKGEGNGSTDSSQKVTKSSKQQHYKEDVFSNVCPLQSLDILINQLRKTILKEPENNNLQKIIVEMENTLREIAADNFQYHKKYKEHCDRNECGNNPNAVRRSELTTCANNTKERNSSLDDLRKGLEESCRYLQSLCAKQNETCNDYLREKEQLSVQLAESRRLLAVAKSREKDYEVTIGDLRLKLQEAGSRNDHQYHSEKELVDTVARLKTEIETLSCFKEAVTKLKSRLKETSKKKEILRSKIYMKDLEIEKLKVLLEVKENLNPSFNITNKEIDVKSQENGLRLDLPNENIDPKFTSGAMRNSWVQEKADLACSSQMSGSIRLSPTPCNSWQRISSIYQHPTPASTINRSIANLFQSLKMKTDRDEPPQLDLEMPSSSSSFWSEKDEPNVNPKKPSTGRDSASTSS